MRKAGNRVKLLSYILVYWEGSQEASIFCDFSKAFDYVNRNTLIRKLHHYVIRGRASDTFYYYL